MSEHREHMVMLTTMRNARRLHVVHLRTCERLTFAAMGKRLGISRECARHLWLYCQRLGLAPRPPRHDAAEVSE